jgi:hypothetical protein
MMKPRRRFNQHVNWQKGNPTTIHYIFAGKISGKIFLHSRTSEQGKKNKDKKQSL